MVTEQDVPSFDDIIQADRLRKRNEELAAEIFGRGRKSTPPVAGGNRRPGTGPSLASRVGIRKPGPRSTSLTPRNAYFESEWVRDLHHHGSPHAPRAPRPHREATIARVARDSRVYEAVTANVQTSGNGMSIRGLAGPYVIIASNFAPGTTSADIESAMTPIGGELVSCRIVTSSPKVVAEILFTDKMGAENVITSFNNQKADGRLLHVYMKQGSSPVLPAQALSPIGAPPPQLIPTEPKAARSDIVRSEPPFEHPPEHSDRNGGRADPELQDGSYGFEAQNETMDVDADGRRDERLDDRRGGRLHERRDDRREPERNPGYGRDSGRGRDDRGLYSDYIYSRPHGRGFR